MNKDQQEQESKAIIYLNSCKITFSKEINTIDGFIFSQNTNFSFDLIKQIIIPSNIISIDLKILYKFPNLITIAVDENNIHYSSKKIYYIQKISIFYILYRQDVYYQHIKCRWKSYLSNQLHFLNILY